MPELISVDRIWDKHGPQMRLIAALLCLAHSGCTANRYQQFDAMFGAWVSTDMVKGVWRTQSDVSWILGGPPSDCESVTADQPKLGVWWDPEQAGTLLLVLPDGPAEAAGLRTGDRVVKLGARFISSSEDTKSAAADLEPDVQTTVEFLRAVPTEAVKPLEVVLTPRMLEVEQCHWHIGTHQRSFRGTFQFVDGRLVQYWPAWPASVQ